MMLDAERVRRSAALLITMQFASFSPAWSQAGTTRGDDVPNLQPGTFTATVEGAAERTLSGPARHLYRSNGSGSGEDPPVEGVMLVLGPIPFQPRGQNNARDGLWLFRRGTAPQPGRVPVGRPVDANVQGGGSAPFIVVLTLDDGLRTELGCTSDGGFVEVREWSEVRASGTLDVQLRCTPRGGRPDQSVPARVRGTFNAAAASPARREEAPPTAAPATAALYGMWTELRNPADPAPKTTFLSLSLLPSGNALLNVGDAVDGTYRVVGKEVRIIAAGDTGVAWVPLGGGSHATAPLI